MAEFDPQLEALAKKLDEMQRHIDLTWGITRSSGYLNEPRPPVGSVRIHPPSQDARLDFRGLLESLSNLFKKH